MGSLQDLPIHKISTGAFSELAAGAGGASAVRQLAAAQRSKHILLLRHVVESASLARHSQAEQTQKAYGLLADVQAAERDAVDVVVCHPPVGAWARQTVKLLRSTAHHRAANPGQLAGVAIAAAIRSGAQCSAEVPITDGTVTLPSLGRLTMPAHHKAGMVRIRVARGHAEAVGRGWSFQLPAGPSPDSSPWQGLRQISATAHGRTLTVLVEDLDEHRMPGYTGVSPRLSAEASLQWETALREGWQTLVSYHPHVADEVSATMRTLTPLNPPPVGLVSASSRETFGGIGVSLPPDARSFAVTLAHETQHAKLSALLDIVALLKPDDGRLYYAPWRNDPRPLAGLLHGAYAFLGVADFWRRQRSVESGAAAVDAHAEFARWWDAVALVIATLATSKRLTGAGEAFVAGMSQAVRSWTGESVPDEAAEIARRLTADHHARWLRVNGTCRAAVLAPSSTAAAGRSQTPGDDHP